MNVKYFEEFNLSLPVLFIPIGEKDSLTDIIIDKISHSTISIENRIGIIQDHNLIDFFNEKKMLLPDVISTNIIKCNSVDDFCNFLQRMQNEKFIPFYQFRTVLILIDVKINKNIDILESMKNLCKNENVGVIYFRAGEDMAMYHSETCHISFESFGEKAIVYIEQFLSQLIKLSITKTIDDTLDSLKNQKLSYKNIFMFLSNNFTNVVKAFEELTKPGQTDFLKSAISFEVLALIQLKFPNSLDLKKRCEQTSNYVWDIDKYYALYEENDLFISFIQAASYYYKSGRKSKFLDCMLKAICCTSSPSYLINNVANYISRHSKKENNQKLLRFATDLISITNEISQKKVPLLLYIFSNSFTPEIQINFKKKILNMFIGKIKNDIVLRELYSNILTSLLSSVMQPSLICKLILDYLSVVGEYISEEEQKKLFNKLIDLAMGDIRIPCKLGFKASSLKIIQPSLKILSQRNNSSTSNSVFKFSYILRNNSNSSEVTVGVGNQLRIEFDIYNPYKICLLVVIHIDVPNCITYYSPYPLSEQSKTKINYCFKPDTPGTFTIDTVECIIHEASQRISFENPLTIKVIPNTVQFSYRTDLTTQCKMKLYDGEKVNFNIWVINTGSIPIDNVELKFQKGIIITHLNQDSIPILPFKERKINIEMIIQGKIENIDISIICSSSLNEFQSLMRINQPIDVIQSISLSRIYLLKYYPKIYIDFSKFILIALDITNKSSQMFNYSISFDQCYDIGCNFDSILLKNPTKGILSEKETIVSIVAVDRELLKNAKEVDEKRLIAAAQVEEDRLQKKLNVKQREELKKRLAISMFLETNLKFEWHITSGRCGTFGCHNQISDVELLNELNNIRPLVTHTFSPSIDQDTIKMNEIIKLTVNYSNELIIKCKVDLCDYINPEYGVAWIGKTEKYNPNGSDSFTFSFYFTKPGNLTFTIEYETIRNVTGFSCIKFNVVE